MEGRQGNPVFVHSLLVHHKSGLARSLAATPKAGSKGDGLIPDPTQASTITRTLGGFMGGVPRGPRGQDSAGSNPER